MEIPKTVTMQVIYPDGDPGGVIIIDNRPPTGRAIVFSRSLWDAVSRNQDYKKCFFEQKGVYVLWRPQSANGKKPMVYVGQSDKERVGGRIRRHLRKDNWDWTRVVVYTASHLHASQIEARLYREADEAKVCDLKNAQKPRLLTQSDADKAETNLHIYNLTRFFLPLAGCDFFRPRDDAVAEQKKTPTTKAAPVVAVSAPHSADLHLSKQAVKARGRETDKGFLVCRGSQAKKHEAPSYNKRYADVRNALIKQGILVSDGDTYRFEQDYTFTTSYMATSVIYGRATSGLDKWQDAKGRTLRELQKQ